MGDTITATLRCEVIKPLSGDWDQFGAMLRALSAPLHRVENRIVTRLELDHERRQNGENLPHPQTLAYRYARDFWKGERETAAERVEKGKPYTGDEAIATTEPAGAVILGVAGAAYARWQKFAKERWEGSMSLPTFTHGSPIFVASSSGAVKLRAEDGSYILDAKLTAGHGRTTIIVKPYGPSGYASISKIVAGEHKLGDLRLLRDHDGKWQAMLAHTFPAPAKIEGRTMAIHRGVRNFLTLAISETEGRESYTTILEAGGDILAHKAAYSARRRSLGEHRRSLGDGARGHGIERREKHVTKLEDRDADWVKTKCQQVAARVIKIALQRGVGRVLVEKWSNPAKDGAPELGEHVEYLVRSWPFAQLKDCIVWAAKLKGITVEEAQGGGNGTDCPKCGHRHEKAPVGKFKCEACGITRESDVIFVWNMLIHAGQKSPVGDAKRIAKRQAARIKRALAEKGKV